MIPTSALHIAIPVGIAAAAVIACGPRERKATIPAGTMLVAALSDEVSTQNSEAGDEIELRTVEPVRLDDGAEIPQGTLISGTVTDAKRGGRSVGPPELGIRFTALKIDGDTHIISTEQVRFGTLGVRATRSNQLVLRAGQRLRIRLSRPVTIEYRPSTEPIQASE